MISQEYNVGLKPSYIFFDRMAIWVRFLNVPLGWMNRKGGEKLGEMVGRTDKVDVDARGKSSGFNMTPRRNGLSRSKQPAGLVQSSI